MEYMWFYYKSKRIYNIIFIITDVAILMQTTNKDT